MNASTYALVALSAFAVFGGATAQHPLNCTAPIDGWNLVATYDNSQHDNEHVFHYNEKVGTLYHGAGHPTEEQQAEFFQAFADILGELNSLTFSTSIKGQSFLNAVFLN